MRPSVVLIVLDTARADAFEPYGAPPGSGPVLADMARRGSAVDRMFATSGWTLPSHASLFTGLEPRAAGLARAPGRSPAGCRPVMEDLRERLLPEVLRRNGWMTAGLSCNGWVGDVSGFDIGFDRFEEHHGKRSVDMVRPGRAAAARWAWEALACVADDGASDTLASLDRTLAASRGEPIFWFANLVECHSPYLPPRPYVDVGPWRRLRAARALRRNYSMGGIWRNCLAELEVDEHDLELLAHLYQRAIGQLDDWLGAVLDRLDRAGRLEDTLVIVTSDHGESFGEAGLIGHSFSLDDWLIHVPFVAMGPGAPVLDRVASLREVPRLIAEAVELEEHPWDDDRLADGVAVAQFDAPAELDARTLSMADGWGLDARGRALLFSDQTAVTDGEQTLVRIGSVDRLDHRGRVPCPPRGASAGDPPPAHLAAAMERAAQPTHVAEPTATEPLDRDLEERMRLLGYL